MRNPTFHPLRFPHPKHEQHPVQPLAVRALCALRTVRTALLSAVAALAVWPAAAADLLPFKATETTLPNGLKLIVVPTGLPNVVSLQIPVQTGSRNEIEPGKSGFAHFFEHMMFRGTAAYPAARYQQLLTRAGVTQNAYTTDDYTNYHTTFAKQDLEKMLELEADRFRNLAFSEDDFKTEARAVLGEYNKSSANPVFKLFEAQREAAFSRHTYRHTTMGFLADIEAMPQQFAYSRLFFDRWYRPEYTTLIIAGDVQPAQALALVRKHWGGWKRGSYRVAVPAEPPPQGPVVRHVAWPTSTLPWVSVAFRAPAFSDRAKDPAALALLMKLAFGPTSALYKRLVQDEQRVDRMFDYLPDSVDPNLATIAARVKRPEDVAAVRDAILQTVAGLRAEPVTRRALADAVSSARYGLTASLDTTESIAATVAQYAHFERSYATVNRYHALFDTLSPEDLRAAARRSFTDAGMVVVTLSNTPLPAAVATLPTLASLAPRAAATPVDVLVQRSALPQIRFKLLFAAGSAHDPPGRQGLAALAAAMVSDAGSTERRIADVKQALFPLAGSFDSQVDKEMTTFTGSIHRDRWAEFIDIVLPLLLSPGLREEDFKRLKDSQLNALRQDLRSNDEEELAKERLQANVYAGTPYGHPVMGTEAGLQAITLDDVRAFQARAYTAGAARVAISGAVSDEMGAALRAAVARLPAGPGLPATATPVGRLPQGIEVEIIEKETRATAVSFGLPIVVTRSHPDYVALSLVRSWLGEHRHSMSHLYQRIREERGMNYGDYAYIEAFPRSGFQTFPVANVARRAQLFEVWIRPVTTVENAHFALRVALTEIDRLLTEGMSAEQFAQTREFLSKYVLLMAASQDVQLGAALDAGWYGTAEFTALMRDGLARLTLAEVNAALRRHLSARQLSVVFVTQQAEELKARLLEDRVATIRYDANKPAALLREDAVIGARRLGIRPEAVRITPVARVFAD